MSEHSARNAALSPEFLAGAATGAAVVALVLLLTGDGLSARIIAAGVAIACLIVLVALDLGEQE